MSHPKPLLDLHQAFRKCVDEEGHAIRVEIGQGTHFQIALDSDSDSVLVHNDSVSLEIDLNDQSSGVILAPVSVKKLSKANLYAQGGSSSVKLQLSPSDDADVWVDSGLSLNLSSSANMANSLSNIVARRARLVLNAPLATGETAKAWLVMGS